MNDLPFRNRVERAIELRSSLTELDCSDLESDTQDQAFLERHVQLDHLIEIWRANLIRKRRRQRTQSAVAGVSLLATGIAAIAFLRDAPQEGAIPEARVPIVASAVPVESDFSPKASTAVLEPVVAPVPRESEQFAAASVTAGRLAYALQPVGEQVSSVVQLLIDSVPGSEVFAL